MALNNNVSEATASEKPAVTKGGKRSGLAQAGRGLYQKMDVETQKNLGSNAKDIAFVALIGNPYNEVPRGDTKGSESVGLIVKNVSDHPVTYYTFKQRSKAVMDADYANAVEKTAEPNEEFQLTWAEAGAFAARNEYNGFFLGDVNKQIRYTPITPRKGKTIPTTKFILYGTTGGSIADYVTDIATKEEMETRSVSPEFQEKFGVFAIQQRANHGVSQKRNGKNINAAALIVNEAFDKLIHSSEEAPVSEESAE